MPVKINGASSGSVTLQAPVSGSDVTVTLPGSAGTLLNTPGAWTAWTPTLTQGTTVPATVARATYTQIGKLIVAQALFVITGSATSGAAITCNLPITAAAGVDAAGSFRHFDAGNTNYVGTTVLGTTTLLYFYVNGYGNAHGQQPANLTNGDNFSFTITYEAA